MGFLGWMQLAVAAPLTWLPSTGVCPVDPVAHQDRIREALAECRGMGTFLTATGIERLRWDVVRACMGARGWVEIGRTERQACERGEPRVALPDDAVAPTATLSCRLRSVSLDPSGEPRVDRGAEARCLSEVHPTVADR
ncbi:MAG: hypothetical protein ABMA64_36805 [Myxococcota bacterium]